jgi:hypothetical protein
MRRIVMAVAGVSMLAAGAARADLLVNISKSQQKVSVTVDGVEAFRWPTSTGRKGYTTPSGTYSPIRLERHWYSHKYENAPMPWSVFFHRGYAVHGTTEAYNLGHAASHGCVRLRPDHAAVLYSLVRQEGMRHTKIVVSDRPLPNAPVPHAPDTPVTSSKPAKQAHSDGGEEAFAKADELGHPRTHSRRGEDAFAQADAPVRHGGMRIIATDEARVLRERQAWLRSLDRKYGITR